MQIEAKRPRPALFTPSDADIIEKIGRLPSIISDARFDDKGFVNSHPGKLMVPAYVGSGFGFNKPGSSFLANFYADLPKLDVFPLDPFSACAEFLPSEVFDGAKTVDENKSLWNKFNGKIGFINYGILMPRSKFMIALVEGQPPDEGLASEISYFASNFGPVLGVRTDFRLAENPAASSNPAMTFFMQDQGPYGGQYFDGSSGYESLMVNIQRLVSEIKS